MEFGEIIKIKQEDGLMHTKNEKAPLKTWQKVVYFFVLPFVVLLAALGILGGVTFSLF